MGADLFLLERAFDECLDRLGAIGTRAKRALLIGCPSYRWAERLHDFAKDVQVVDPGPLFAERAGGIAADEDRHDFGEKEFGLCVAVGTLDTVNDLPIALQRIRRSLVPHSPFLGAMVGGNSLPALRKALIEAERNAGRVVARTHPRIEPSSLAGLLTAAGFAMPVVDVDRVRLRYPDLTVLVNDLRSMGAAGLMSQRPPPMSKSSARLASEAFAQEGSDGRTEEILEILHFIGWSQ